MGALQDYMQKYGVKPLNRDATATEAPIDYSQLPSAPPPPPSNKSDIGLSLKAGIQQLPGIATGLADIPFALAANARPVSSLADWMGQATGFQPAKWAAETEAQHTPEYQKSQAEIGKVWESPQTGALDVAKAYATHPGYVANQVVQSLPSMVAGGALSKVLMTAGRGLIPAAEGMAARTTPGILERKAGEWAAPIAGGVGEGAVQAGQQMDRYQGEDQRKNAIAALGSGAIDALIAAGGGRLANKLGWETPETYMAKVGDKTVERVVGTGAELPSKMSRIVGGMLSEGALQEFPQSFQEQMWQNFADNKPLSQGAMRQAVEGGLAGAFLGAGANALPSKMRNTPPGSVGNDDLKQVVDQQIAPPAETEPMQAEYARMQREQQIANQPQGNQYPEIKAAPTEQLQRLAESLASPQGRNVENAADVQAAIAQELQARAPKPETPLSRADQEIAATMAAHEAPAPQVDPLAAEWAQREQALTEQNAQQQRLAQVRQAQQQRAASVQPTAPAAAQAADRAMAVEEGRDLFGNVTPQAENLSTSAAVPSAASLVAQLPKTLRGQERSRLTTAPVEDLPQRLYALWEKKGGFGSTSAYVQDVGNLYNQITGQQIQDHPNNMTQQVSAALREGMQTAPTQGEFVDNGRGALQAVPKLTKQQQRKVMDATMASVDAGQAPAAALGQNIPEAPNAIQESRPARLDARQPAQVGQEVGQGNTQRRVVAAKGAAQEAVAQPAVQVAAPVAAAGEQLVGAKLKSGRTATAYTFEGLKKAYFRTRSGAAHRIARVAELTGIAELELITKTKTEQKRANEAREFLDGPDVDEQEAAEARRHAADDAARMERQEKILARRDEAKAKRQAAVEQQVTEMTEEERKARQKPKGRVTQEHIDAWIAELERDNKIAKSVGMAESGATQGVTGKDFHTQVSLAVELAKAFGQPLMTAMKSGRVVILPNQLHLAAVTGRLEHRLSSSQGLYVHDQRNPKNGITYFVAGNISKTMQGFKAVDIALHEIGEHAGMQHMLGKAGYQQVINRIRTAMMRNDAGSPTEPFDAEVAAAQKRLLKSQQGNAREVLAYMIQHTPDAGILQKMWAQLKAWAVRAGLMNPDDQRVNAQVLRALAMGATNKWLAEVGPTKPSEALKPGNTTINFSGVESPETRKVFTNYNAAAEGAQQVFDKVVKGNWPNAKLSAFRKIIPWLTKHHLISQYDKLFNGGLAMNGKADSVQQTMATRMSHLFNGPYQKFMEISRQDKKTAKTITDLMQATEHQVDPRKTWDQQTHLHKLTGTALTDAQKAVSVARQKWGRLSPEAKAVYNDLALMNETTYTAEMAVMTYNMMKANPETKGLPIVKVDPSDQFRESAKTHDAIKDAHEYWRGVLDSYTAAIEQHIAKQRGTLPQKQEHDPEYQALVKSVLKGIASDKAKEVVRRALRTKENKDLTEEQKTTVRHLSPLEAQMRMINETTASFEHAPYFHLGRFGDHFVSFRIRTGSGEQADPKAMEHVQRELAKDFDNIVIRPDATDPHVFTRFESLGQAQAFVEKLQDLQKQGWLMQEGIKDKNNNDLGTIQYNTRTENIAGYHTAGPNWLSRVVESIESEDYDDATKAQMIANIRSLYLDSLPDTAAIKVKQKREGVPGWDADMIRSYAHRMRIGANRVGSLAAEPLRTESFATMKAAQAQVATKNIPAATKARMAAVVSEFERRNSDQMHVPESPSIDALRAINHAYFLGLSPSYVLLQMTQLGSLTLPELAKTNGYVKSAKEIGKATNTAFKVIRTVMSEGYKHRGPKGAADMVVTGEMLEKSGIAKADADFLIRLMAMGKIDIGNAAREIGRVAEGTTGSEALKIASAMGYMSETLTRMATALAAKKLYDADSSNKSGMTAEEYAAHVIDESMFNYASENIARMTGKQGIANTLSPMIFSFMQYQFQLLEKLYREVHDAYVNDPSLTAKEREIRQKEARKFLAAHMGSMLVLAGSLGLPFASVIAAAMDKLCGINGEYCDSQTAMRNMTADVFGHDIEPIISKGLTRAIGADISTRTGEADILPFSKFLADKRAVNDALKDLAVSAWGAPTSMVAGMYSGMKRMADGDLLGGMQEAMPLAIRGPLKAYEMTEKGYVDKAGNVLPMSPGAWDVMVQTLGVNPGEKADYQQAKFAQSQRAGVLSREGTMIRQKLASAIEQGDQSAMRDWLGKAQDYDAQNPDRGILRGIGSTLQQRARAKAQAIGTGTPLGVSPKDYSAQKFTSFYQQ